MSVATIICAYNAAATIGRAVASALAEPEVVELIVVDDASTDDSSARALAADDGTGRLRLIRLQVNAGPSAARNVAIEASNADYIAILDADDFFLPGRFAVLLADPDWDLIADNILFVLEDALEAFAMPTPTRDPPAIEQLDLASFVEGNISSRFAPRGELGFIKPVIRRAFLEQHGLRYDERLRLGEDYALYTMALAKGAQMGLSRRCGYVAVERRASLSGRHRTADLFALTGADRALLELAGLTSAERGLIGRHLRQVSAKARHREFLDQRRSAGLLRAIATAAIRPARFAGIARDVLLDKLARLRPPPDRPAVRLLLGGD